MTEPISPSKRVPKLIFDRDEALRLNLYINERKYINFGYRVFSPEHL